MPALLVLLLVVVPVVEIYVIVQVGQAVGAWPTVALLLLEGVLGAWVVRREGRRAWAGLQRALRAGRVPDRELADGALVLVGGTLLLTPGFVTDVAGFLMILPPSRLLLRRALLAWLTRRVLRVAGLPGRGRRGGGAGHVVRGELADPTERPDS